MLGRFWGVFTLLLTVCGSAQAQTVPPGPAPTAAPVVEEQHPIQVGDVIMAPVIEEPKSERARAREAAELRPRRWYGAPILIADGVAYGSLLLAVNAEKTAPVALPLTVGTFLLSGPITHGVHGQWGRMGLSVASRTALPFTGLLLAAIGCTTDSDCGDTLASGAVAGMLAATIVDSVVLSYEPVTATPTVQPLVSVAKNQLWLGAGGTF